jgi:DNA-binding response OmpR family regulator
MATVLVVEDSADMRQLMHDLLENLGHNVLEAKDGLEGVRVAITNRPDLIILDLMMPAAAGDSALQFMRGTPGLEKIPVLVVSAHSDVAHIAKQYGADDWMAKPVRIDELSRRIAALLASRSQPSAP